MCKRPLSEVHTTNWEDIDLPTLAAKSILGTHLPFEVWQTDVEESCGEIEMEEGATWPTPSEVSALLKTWGKIVKKPKGSTKGSTKGSAKKCTVYDLGIAVGMDEFKSAVARVLRVAYSQPAVYDFCDSKHKGCENQLEKGLPVEENLEKWEERCAIVDSHESGGAGDDLLEAVKARDLEALNEIIGGWQTADCL